MHRSSPVSDLLTRRHARFSRRTAIGMATTTAFGAASLGAQQGTPEASPVASPVGTPRSTPDVVTPEPTYPLQIITDQRPPWAGQPVHGGSLKLFARPDAFDDFIPTHFRQDFGVMVSYMDPLVWADQVTLEPKPWLARSWTFGGDGLTLEIELRDNVNWHDGTPFTAEDVRFSLLCYRDDYDSAVSFLLAVMKDVEVLDHLTVRIVFDEPDGNFPFNAANLPMFQRQQWEAHWLRNDQGERTLSDMDFGDSQPLGTGPWAIESRHDDRIEFRPNEQHFGAVPWAEHLTLTVEPDFESQFESWQDDDASLIWPFPGRDVEANRDEPGFLVVAESTVSYFAAFNFENPLRAEPGMLALPGIREAMNLAINRQAYAEDVFGGMIDVDRAGFMTQPWAVDTTVRNPERNVATARQMLADYGWGDWDGDGVLDSPTGDRGAFTCIVRDDADLNLLAILDGLDADFREIGLALEIQRLAPDAYSNRWINLFDYDLIAIQLNQYPAFNEFDLVGSAWSIRRNPAGWNPGGYWNPAVDDAIFAYLSSTEVDAMREQLQIIQQQTNEDLFALWLGFPSQPVLIRPDISGFQPNKMWQSWNTWALWHAEDSSVVTPTPLPPTPTPTPTPTQVPTEVPVATPQASPVATPAR